MCRSLEGLKMGEAHRDGVRRIRRGRDGEPEQGADHEGHLGFLGCSVAYHSLLDAARSVFVDR